MKLEPITIKGKTFEVELQQSGGLFVTQLDGVGIGAESLAMLKARIMKQMARSKKLNIPMAAWVPKSSYGDSTGELKRGVITGIHASNNNLMVKWDGEKPQQLDRYEVSQFVEPSKADKLEELGKDLNAAYLKYSIAKDRLRGFLENSGFNGRERTEEVLAAESSEEE